jgi:DNA-directed RNA polymerase specialized sigma24 family protein
MRFRRPRRCFTYEDFVNERIVPQGRVPPLHALLRSMRRYAACLRRKGSLRPDEIWLLALLAEVERSYVWLLCTGAPWHDAEEVVLTSLAKLYERQDKIPPEKRPAWFATAVRKTNQERRREWATKHRLAPDVAHHQAEQAAAAYRAADVQIGMAQLDADAQRLFRTLRLEEQAVVDLHAFQDTTMEDVAAALKITPATARKRWRLAVDRLLEHIEREDIREGHKYGELKRYVLAAAALLWLRLRRWLRWLGDAVRDETASATRAARWPIVAIAVPLLAVPIMVLLRRAPSAPEVSSVEEAMASAEAMPSVGLFLSTWAERERDSDDPVTAPTLASNAGRSAPESAVPAPREARDLLGTAQAALAKDARSIAAHALNRYESMYPDDPYPVIHAELRVALALKSVPR